MKDFNLVKFLKTNKLGSYGMINENYMDLPAVNNYSEQHPIHNISEEDFDGDDNGAPMDAISRAEGIVDENQLNKFRMAAMALIGDMENDGFETEEAIDVLKQIIDAQMGKESNSGLNESEVAYVVRNGKCYKKDDEGNSSEVSYIECKRRGIY
jgi:hypothetical protein